MTKDTSYRTEYHSLGRCSLASRNKSFQTFSTLLHLAGRLLIMLQKNLSYYFILHRQTYENNLSRYRFPPMIKFLWVKWENDR